MKYVTHVIKAIDYFWMVASMLLAAATGYLILDNIKLNLETKIQSAKLLEYRYSLDDAAKVYAESARLHAVITEENRNLIAQLLMCTGARERNNRRFRKYLHKTSKTNNLGGTK